MQRKAPKPSNDGPLRSKLASVVARPLNFKTSSAIVGPQSSRGPDDVIAQLFEAASSSPPLQPLPAQTAASVPPAMTAFPKTSRKRRRDSIVEDDDEFAIFTEASTQHRHIITANSLREVIAQKRAKLTHTTTESQLMQMELDDPEEAKDEEEDDVT